MIRPYLRWAGGKETKLGVFDRFRPPRGDYYCEPCFGAGSMCWHLHPAHAVIGDLNPHLVNSLQVIQHAVDALIVSLEVHVRDDTEEHYYAVRDEFNAFDQRLYGAASDDVIQQAARFIYLNARGYNGLYRENKSGQYNVGCNLQPHVHHPRRIYDRANLHRIASYLNNKNVTIYHGSYEMSLQYLEGAPRTFVFLDPPYYSEDGAGFTAYTSETWGTRDLAKLATYCDRLDELGHWFLCCNADYPVVRETFGNYDVQGHQVPRYINSDPEGRGPVPEVAVTNYPVKRYKTLLSYLEV